jgi:hypothetical protein
MAFFLHFGKETKKLLAWSVAQLVERLSCKRKTRVQVPAAPILFGVICWPWLGIDQIKFQSLFEGESDG